MVTTPDYILPIPHPWLDGVYTPLRQAGALGIATHYCAREDAPRAFAEGWEFAFPAPVAGCSMRVDHGEPWTIRGQRVS